ncbi:hypothetical protein [Goodfellowiella coeruleoviolacea]|uniref:hypothetical protein n=1 Tax=Goodfellowiella coeruleoviolacea TaxID=334858 RepID=UPI0020A241E7|nr:hypothetical protein [Goodfellowiella coeruleoviolacea]
MSRLWQNGLAITISEPKSLAPSDTAYPKAPRAAVFEVTVSNGGSNPYKPSELSVRAIVAGEHAQEVLDSAQGLNGIASANEEVLPGKQLTTTLAFAMPEQRAPVKVTVQPSTSSQVTPEAVYEGQA